MSLREITCPCDESEGDYILMGRFYGRLHESEGDYTPTYDESEGDYMPM